MARHLNDSTNFFQLGHLSRLVLIIIARLISVVAETVVSGGGPGCEPPAEPAYNLLCISDCPTCPAICSPPPPSPNPTYSSPRPPSTPSSPGPLPQLQNPPPDYFYFRNPPPLMKQSPSPPLIEVPSIYPYWGSHPPPPPPSPPPPSPPPPYKPHNSPPQAPPHSYTTTSNNPYYYFYASDNAAPNHLSFPATTVALPFLCILLSNVL